MRRWMFAVAAATLALAGCKSGQKWTAAAPTPAQRSLADTNFPHSMHGGFDCDTCHDAAKWNKLGDYVAPTVEKCGECHDTDEMHTPKPAPKKTEYLLAFSHADHMPKLEGRKDPCRVCHKALPEPGEDVKTTPPMTACTSCHHHQVEVMEAKCRPCHTSLKTYGLKPLEQFTEFSHAGNFVREHGELSRSSAETCAACHDQTYCAQCHATATRPFRPEIRFPENVTSDFIHRGDYVARHHLDVERDPASCRKCHGSHFCNSCHDQQLVERGPLGERVGRASPHPRTGWVQRGAGDWHGEVARNNIVSCAGCHDQGASSICVGCHTVGGVGGNPHPAGWRSRHDRGDISKNVACRACHR
jgi:hypothetical protein